jgi:integrase
MFRKTVTKALPPGANILDGNRASIPGKGGKRRIVPINASGRMIVETKTWYTRVGGKVVPLLPDRDSAKEMAAQVELDSRRVSRGLEPILPSVATQEQELGTLLGQWIDEQTMAGRHQVRVAVDQARVQWILKAGNLATVADLSRQGAGEAIGKALDARREESQAKVLTKGDKFTPAQIRTILGISVSGLWKMARMAGVEGTGKGKAKTYTRQEALKLLASRKTTVSPVTLNGYRVAFGSFCRWLVRRGTLSKVPYTGKKSDEKKDRRLVRRAISWAECQRLADVTQGSGVVRGGMNARSRSVLYLVAFTSLLRARALRELTPGDCHLDGESPWLSVRGETDKKGVSRAIPIPMEVAGRLAEIIDKRPKGKPVWDMPENIAAVLRGDLRQAGIPYRTPDGVVDLHAMRHSGISHLVAKGTNPFIVAKLAGHSDVKQILARYGHLSPGNLAELTKGAW